MDATAMVAAAMDELVALISGDQSRLFSGDSSEYSFLHMSQSSKVCLFCSRTLVPTKVYWSGVFNVYRHGGAGADLRS